jgi:hypothetical protein
MMDKTQQTKNMINRFMFLICKFAQYLHICGIDLDGLFYSFQGEERVEDKQKTRKKKNHNLPTRPSFWSLQFRREIMKNEYRNGYTAWSFLYCFSIHELLGDFFFLVFPNILNETTSNDPLQYRFFQ